MDVNWIWHIPGYGLGFVNLGKGRLDQGTIDDGIDGVLRRFVVGGPKPSHPNAGRIKHSLLSFCFILHALRWRTNIIVDSR